MATLEQVNGVLNIVITPDDLSARITFTTGAVAMPLTGYTFVATMRYNGNSTALTVINTDLAGGVITLVITDAQAVAAGYGIHLWELEWTVGGLKRTALAGTLEIRYKA